MKKLIFILLFTSIQAQEVSFRIDPMNAVFGSHVNKPALNYKIGIADYYNYDSRFMIGMEYEHFPTLNYYQWTWAKFDYDFEIGKFSILPGVALSQIYHKTSYSHNSMSYAFNLEFRYRLSNHFKLSLQFNRERASDITQLWRDSSYTGIIYNWNKNK